MCFIHFTEEMQLDGETLEILKGSIALLKEAGHFLHVQNHDLVKFIIRQWYTFNKNFKYQNEERHLIYSLS